MFKSKFFNILWGINGILLILVFTIILYTFISEKYPLLFRGSTRKHDTGIIVGSKVKKAKELNIDLQHLIYDSPQRIKNSKYYFVEVVVLDKELPPGVKDAIAQSNDFSIYNIGATVNIVFFDEGRNNIHKLLPTYGYIKRFYYPKENNEWYYRGESDQGINFILYEIAMKDTDKDGRINSKDSTAFFISDLDGENIKQITPYSLEFDNYSFSRDKSEIYFEILTKHKDKDVFGYYLRSRNLYYYNLKTEKFGKFEELDDMLSSIKKDFSQ